MNFCLPKVKCNHMVIAKCPFCKSYNVSLSMKEKICVHCNECGSNGPQGWAASECVEKWNEVSIRSGT